MTDSPAPGSMKAEQPLAEQKEGQSVSPSEARKDGNNESKTDSAGGNAGVKVEGLSAEAIFTQCRTAERFASRPVGEDVQRRLYDLLKLGPTSGNCSPARFAFLQSEEARQALRPALSMGNVELAMAAPLVVVVGYDPLFFEKFSALNSLPGLRDWFAADVGLSDETAFRNGTLQGAYLIMAARALGLAVRPMSGFDAVMVEEQCFRQQGWRANFLVALGYPDEEETVPPRAPRLPVEEACLWL